MTETEPILGGAVISRPAPINYRYGDEVGFWLMSDLHVGASQVDYKLIERELKEAGARNDRILINGDLVDGILPKDHKRYSPEALHPRISNRRDVVNAVIEWCVELLSPYVHLIDMIGVGNHETALEKWHSVDPVALVVYELGKRIPEKHKNHHINYGGYTGFVDYRLRPSTTEGKTYGTVRAGGSGGSRYVLWYHHGSGGASPVTKGMIDFNRKDTFIDADLLWLGHKHNKWNAEVQKLSCPREGPHPTVKNVRHVMTGAYFQTYRGQTQNEIKKHGRRSNYAADWGVAPQGMGGARVSLQFNRDGYRVQVAH